MLNLIQKNTFLSLTSILGKDALIPTEFDGSESISNLFTYHIETLSAQNTIKPETLIGTSMTLQIQIPGSAPRYFNGIVKKFFAGGNQQGMRQYHIVLIPWLGLLGYTKDYRIFKNKNIIDMLKEIFTERGFHDFDVSGLQKKYLPEEYCTQYGETTLNFVHRLLEAKGIFYFFKQTKDKHMIILADQPAVHLPCPNSTVIYTNNNIRGQRHYIHHWQHSYKLYSGQYAHTDYNFETSALCLHGEQEKPCQLSIASRYGIYDYPGGYEAAKQGENLATQRFEAEQAEYDLIHGGSNHAGFSPGSSFTLTAHPQRTEQGEYVLLNVNHTAHHDGHYSNHFRCLPKKTPYRPKQRTPKPVISGSQTAIVVGSKGEEISTDKYGRIQVRFHWVRQDAKAKSETQSRWVRVAHSWAGNGYGIFFLPHINQEVVVQFLNGDPDQPLIIGCVYNADHMPPYPLPAHQTQSGIKTRRTNELRFEDKEGSEEIYIHAKKDFKLKAINSIELAVGSNCIKITPTDIQINGAKILVNKS